MNSRTVAGLLGFALVVGVSKAQEIPTTKIEPSSYDMLNGEQGLFTYFDDSYSGTGNRSAPNAALSGGLGDLTDRNIATQSWASSPGLYVGWARVKPVITFRFSKPTAFSSMTLYVDDSNGGGGVTPPSAIRVKVGDFEQRVVSVVDPPGGAPFPITVPLGGDVGVDVQVTLEDGGEPWIMLSEVRFDGSDADCNGDGLVDYSQILNRSLDDDNSNGVPDICEPNVTGVIPVSGPSSGGSSITIKGANFPENPSVLIGGVPATDVARTSATRITATTPAGLPGMTSVTVGNWVQPNAFYYRPECGSDLDQDGEVTAADIAIVLLDFGPCYVSAAPTPAEESRPFMLREEAAPAVIQSR